ncbi:hypothetical protein ACUN9Y_00695 [Halomonas sp. V046]|uniref:hypothetical protein n=1 Tax=Halomonas sp. V046 TaxID=3459611 RepID=UPI004044FCB1
MQGRSTAATPVDGEVDGEADGEVGADDGGDEEAEQDGMAKPADIAGNTSM